MFLLYDYRKFLGYDNKTKLYRWEYEIVDSEFEEIGVVGIVSAVTGIDTIAGIIDTYEKRRLNVAANLIRAFIWQNKEYSWPISDIVKDNKRYNPKFAKYEEQINKYLTLM